MNNAELIKDARIIADSIHVHSSFQDWEAAEKDTLLKCADALEAAGKRIAIVEEERDLERFAAKNYLDKIDELEAQLPKEGEWIEDDTTYCGADRANYKCSLCGKIGGTWKRGLTQDELPNYCPNCGSVMKGGCKK